MHGLSFAISLPKNLVGICIALMIPLMSAVVRATPVDAPVQNFTVPAGVAEKTLVIFSHQAQQPAVFPTDLVRGVQTQAVTGEHTALEALRLMFANTALQPFEDAGSGTLILRRADAPRERVVQLPPYEVEGNRGRPWRYARQAGKEILFRCPKDFAVATVDRYQRLNRMLAMILPPEWQSVRDLSGYLILEDVEFEPPVARELKEAITAHIDDIHGGRASRFLPNFHFRDDAAAITYFVIDVFQPDIMDRSMITPAYLRDVLESRNPPLPRWFIEGLVRWQQDAIIMPVPPLRPELWRAPSGPQSRIDSAPQNSIVSTAQSSMVGALQSSFVSAPQSPHGRHPHYPYDTIKVLPFVWGDHKQNKRIEQMTRREATAGGLAILPLHFKLLSMPDLLQSQQAGAWQGGDGEVAVLQAALFLRWIFDPAPKTPAADKLLRPGVKPGPDALWTFLARCEREGLSEQLFEECIGWTYAEMDTILRSYLPYATLSSAGFSIDSREPVQELADLNDREASTDEVSRIQGLMNRLSMHYVGTFHPELLPSYTTQARRTLRRAYDKGSRDPRLLVDLGLVETDVGNDTAALPFLAAAVQAGVDYSRAYYELSRIQYARLRSQHPAAGPTDPEILRITNQLRHGLEQTPALPQTYELLFEIWLRHQVRLSPKEMALLDQGAGRFPQRYRIIYAAMLLHSAHGNGASARRIGHHALPWIVDPVERDKVAQLLQSLETSHP